jgi:methane monooxygenase PmoA-like
MKRKIISRRGFVRSGLRCALGFSAFPLFQAAAGQLRAAQRSRSEVEVDDADGVLGRADAPACALVVLPDRLRRAAAEGRLALREKTRGADAMRRMPVQCLTAPAGGQTRLCWLMPRGNKGRRVFEFETTARSSFRMLAGRVDGQYEISEQGRPVLRYNYAKVDPGDLLKSVSDDNRKYAVARSDYIHPLYGPHGEVLTKDWSADHPHHRGIYWAWPEVDWHGQRGDLHALQKVFARPSGGCEALSGLVFAQLVAVNIWKWEDTEPIIRERTTIRVYPVDARGRMLDLDFLFEALDDPVLVARRGTSHYGGLNIRLSAVKDQRISKHADPAGATPRHVWADLSGSFDGAHEPAGITVIQHTSNPDYPGDWIDYPELNWLQPTFPAAGSRYEIKRDKPLRLRFRLWVHPGAEVSETVGDDIWQAANSPLSPLTAK